MDNSKSTLTLYGQSYALADLPKISRDTLVSLQSDEARMRELKYKLAVCQTAHVDYARVLKSKTDPMRFSLSS